MNRSTYLKDAYEWHQFVGRKDRQCHAPVKVAPSEEFLEQVNDHTDAPSSMQAELTKTKTGMKCKTITINETVEQTLVEQFAFDSQDMTRDPGMHGNMTIFYRFQYIVRIFPHFQAIRS